MKTKDEILSTIDQGLIVSCQMEKHAPCYSEDIVELMVKAALWGGACGLRLEGEANIKNIRNKYDTVIIGLIKIFRKDTEVFMTPSMDEVDRIVEAGADILALDGTDRPIDDHKGYDLIPLVKAKYPNHLILADVRDVEDAIASVELGADLVAPTFYRFSKNAKSTDLPDWKMVANMVKSLSGKASVLMEGKIWTPDDAIKALYYGCKAVVVGSAITRPHLITQRFVDHMHGFDKERSLYY